MQALRPLSLRMYTQETFTFYFCWGKERALILMVDCKYLITNEHAFMFLSKVHIAPDTRLVKICWIILVISTFVCSLSKQYSQSGDIYQFAQMGEC